ncbi:universal stress protein [Natrialbaceae archaeon AArc-T1-2]|uniref:universal stress protein n=1 Tax=Natrialbaceae archaeon AArc-T1-2 TaxID=3053904 RepID=UPI00255A9410|nr:universal stress protein [Natrialbaceae archaeon AArc-T1-2]WIV66733.1 universal stress protein [Natrialbaceae archaeon AArc-T1-2]
MTLVVVPVRYPLSARSKRTLQRAIRVARERDASLTVLHVDLYQNGKNVTRTDLKAAVEETFGHLENARYVVRTGFLVEESILEEVAAEEADVVVIGHKQASRFRRLFRRFTDNPNIEAYLRDHLDCEIITVDGTRT